ncbi:hypothetical protein THRCLA_10144 [Thraustotheca clavata]|uniref:Transmembrane protein n=1 Tax=Thraustotheca clavata TaxID=74557 RepID=A0A1V9YT22_9STRA|nr:hypothetical protein THRCLA_10144 [Thraustotheca clavata]
MGLRSRQRRLAGITRESSLESFEQQNTLKGTLRRSMGLTWSIEHLAHSQNDVAAFNLMWKDFLGKIGYVLIAYEAISLWYSMSFSGIMFVFVFIKVLSCGAIWYSNAYVTLGEHYDEALALSCIHALLWVVFGLFNLNISRKIVPLSAIYFTGTAMSAWFMGSNTKAEVARARQLEKLQFIAKG